MKIQKKNENLNAINQPVLQPSCYSFFSFCFRVIHSFSDDFSTVNLKCHLYDREMLIFNPFSSVKLSLFPQSKKSVMMRKNSLCYYINFCVSFFSSLVHFIYTKNQLYSHTTNKVPHLEYYSTVAKQLTASLYHNV